MNANKFLNSYFKVQWHHLRHVLFIYQARGYLESNKEDWKENSQNREIVHDS